MKTLIICCSYHHKNTEKVAKAIAKVLNAQIKAPDEIILEELQLYKLVGFGSGIDTAKHYKPLIELADRLPQANSKKAFIFSTCGIPGAFSKGEQFNAMVEKNHSLLKVKLQNKGYIVIDEFSCVGFNTNSFLKLFGGLNRNRPSTEDLNNAEEFARRLGQID